MKQQKSIVVTAYALTSNLDEEDVGEDSDYLNNYLENGWTVVQISPMGGGNISAKSSIHAIFASLVIIEKEL